MTLRAYYQEKESERNRMGQGKKLSKDMVSTGDQLHSPSSYKELWSTERPRPGGQPPVSSCHSVTGHKLPMGRRLYHLLDEIPLVPTVTAPQKRVTVRDYQPTLTAAGGWIHLPAGKGNLDKVPTANTMTLITNSSLKITDLCPEYDLNLSTSLHLQYPTKCFHTSTLLVGLVPLLGMLFSTRECLCIFPVQVQMSPLFYNLC